METINYFFLLVILTTAITLPQGLDNNRTDSTEHTQYRHGVEPSLDEEGRNFYQFSKISGNTGLWRELNPNVPRVNYYGVYFRDELNGFAVGEFGAIIKTIDGGLSWIDKSYPTEKTLLRVSGSESFVIIVGKSGTILKSSDFGDTWESVNVINNIDIWGVYTFNNTECFICANDGQLLKTTDAGTSWQIDTIGYPLIYWDLQFLDSKIGFISCSNGVMVKTTDTGATWTIKQIGDLYSLYSVEILPNGNIVTAGYSGKIYYSTDLGETFTQSVVPIQFVIEDLAFANNDIGIAIGQATITNAILKTKDGGLNWDLIRQPMGHLNADFVTDSIGYNVGIDLRVLKSTDQGNSWQKRFLNDNLYDIKFTSASIGYVISGSLYKTTNFGETWNKLLNGVGGYSLNFIDSLTGFAGNNNGIINKTTDGGFNWYNVNHTPGDGEIKEIKFSSNTLGWALSKNLYKTTNAGETWSQVLNGTYYNDFSFPDTLNGWVVGNGVKRTTNGGISWETINPSAFFYSVYFSDIDTGYAASGYLYKTTDGGYTWEIINGITGRDLEVVEDSMLITMDYNGKVFISMDRGISWTDYDVPIGRSLKFVDKSRGYFVGNTGLIYEYFDSTYTPVELTNFNVRQEGETVRLNWSTASELNNRGFEIEKRTEDIKWASIGFINGNGTTTGLNEYLFVDNHPHKGKNIYRLKQIDFNGCCSYSGEKEIYISFSNETLLYQNYPNPFNPTTRINFSLTSNSNVTLKLFDALGREVSVIINKYMNSGNYNIDLNASAYPSGVYFYSLETNGANGKRTNLVKKMVIIR